LASLDAEIGPAVVVRTGRGKPGAPQSRRRADQVRHLDGWQPSRELTGRLGMRRHTHRAGNEPPFNSAVRGASMQDLELEITHKIAELAEIAPERVQRDVPLKELGVDSLMVLEIVAFIERRLKCEIAESEIPKVRTLSDILARVGDGHGNGNGNGNGRH
jgi:acyl carrier protein